MEDSQRKEQSVVMKLDQSDYENIYLRVRDKLLRAVGVMLLAVAGGTIYVAMQTITTATEAAVGKYVQSERFQKDVVRSYSNGLRQLEARTDELSRSISQQENRIAELSGAAAAIDANGLTITDRSGNRFYIETGSAQAGSKTRFNRKFSKPPLVVLTVDGTKLDSFQTNRLERGGAMAAVSASTEGFELPSSLYQYNYRWVAFGN